MKFFASIMAFLILGLSVLPCRDGKAMSMDTKSHIVKDSHTDAGDHKQDNHQDNCSPLCICSCCSVASVFHSLISVDIAPMENEIDHHSHYSGSLIGISLPIWQPPQLI